MHACTYIYSHIPSSPFAYFQRVNESLHGEYLISNRLTSVKRGGDGVHAANTQFQQRAVQVADAIQVSVGCTYHLNVMCVLYVCVYLCVCLCVCVLRTRSSSNELFRWQMRLR
jgi:hypothetical protein